MVLVELYPPVGLPRLCLGEAVQARDEAGLLQASRAKGARGIAPHLGSEGFRLG